MHITMLLLLGVFCFFNNLFSCENKKSMGYAFTGYNRPDAVRSAWYILKSDFEIQKRVALTQVFLPFVQQKDPGKVSLVQKYVWEKKYLKIELIDQKYNVKSIAYVNPVYLDIDLLGNLILDSVALHSRTYIQDNRSRILPYIISDIYKLYITNRIPQFVCEEIKQEYIRLKKLPKNQMMTFLLSSDYGLADDLLPIIYAYINTPVVQTPYPRALLKPYIKPMQ